MRALLNTTPVVDGAPVDQLADPAAARAWLARQAEAGTDAELRQVRAAPGRAPGGGAR